MWKSLSSVFRPEISEVLQWRNCDFTRKVAKGHRSKRHRYHWLVYDIYMNNFALKSMKKPKLLFSQPNRKVSFSHSDYRIKRNPSPIAASRERYEYPWILSLKVWLLFKIVCYLMFSLFICVFPVKTLQEKKRKPQSGFWVQFCSI